MKKLITLLLTLTLIFGVFVSCEKPNETDTASSSEDTSAEHVFRAIVIEINESSVLIEPLEGEGERNSADRIRIDVSDLDDIDAAVGSIVEVTYDGYIMETYPAQINVRGWKLSN